jgi:hypothetical protein
MEEQSHKQEMAAALRGDFERLRARREGRDTSGPGAPSPAGAQPVSQPASPVPGAAGDADRSFVARVFRR